MSAYENHFLRQPLHLQSAKSTLGNIFSVKIVVRPTAAHLGLVFWDGEGGRGGELCRCHRIWDVRALPPPTSCLSAASAAAGRCRRPPHGVARSGRGGKGHHRLDLGGGCAVAYDHLPPSCLNRCMRPREVGALSPTTTCLQAASVVACGRRPPQHVAGSGREGEHHR